jgi:DNA polymerase III delta prime subunit
LKWINLNIKYSSVEKLITRSKNAVLAIDAIEKLDSDVWDIYDDFVSEDNNTDGFEQTGLFRIKFNDSSYIYLIFQKTTDIFSQTFCVGVGKENEWQKFKKIFNKVNYHRNYPEIGFAKTVVHTNHIEGKSEIKYSDVSIKELPHVEVFHPAYNEIISDVESFFNCDNELYQRYNKPKVRKIILSGEPGTGKTLISLTLSKKYLKSHSIVTVNDFKAMRMHFDKVFESDMPSIIIFEDCERELYQINSEGLNFLDGINQPLHKKGVYIIFTTNYPYIIPDRIVKRPGRVDRIFNINMLKDDYALNCAKYYFKDVLSITEKHNDLFNNLTGAQIAGLATSSILLALGNNQQVSFEHIKKCKKDMLDSMNDLEEKAKRESHNVKKLIGFRNELRNNYHEEDDLPF